MADYPGSLYRRNVRIERTKTLFLPRLASTVFGIFGGFGLLLAAVGLYGVIDRVEQLATFPGIGRPGEMQGTRELVSQPYVIVYRYTD